MNKEQEVIDILKRTIKNSNYCDSIGTGQIEILLNYIDKLQQELKDSINARFELQRRIDKTQKENENLKTDYQILQDDLKEHNIIYTDTPEFEEKYISKDKIKEALGDKDLPDEMILIYIETLVDENNRLEDIEDRKVQIEYNNVFNKGVKSVEDKIRTKIKELEEQQAIEIEETGMSLLSVPIRILKELLGDDE